MMRMLALAYLLTPGSSHASHTSVPAPGAAMVLSAMPLRVWGTPSQSTAWWVGAVAGVVLRGGADDHFSEDPRPSGPQRHVVPSMYESLDECIHDVRTGDTIFLQGLGYNYRTYEGGEWGWHSWVAPMYVTNECLWRSRKLGFPHSGAKTLDELRQYYREADKAGRGLIKIETTIIGGKGELFFEGAPGVKVSGQLVLCANTTGHFKGPMTLALLSDVNFILQQNDIRYCQNVKAAVSVHGEGWSFENCQIRASGGTALRCDREARAKLEGCAIGGLLAYDVDGRLCKAARAISVIKSARCILLGCSVEHTEVHKYDYKGGVAIKVSQEAEVVLEDCILHSHEGVAIMFDEFDDLGERYDNSARVRIANTAIKQCGVAAFSSRGDTSGALLRVRHSSTYGPDLWANHHRPGLLEFEDNAHINVSHAAGNGHAARAHECFRSMFWYTPKTETDHDEREEGRVDWQAFFEDSLNDSRDPDPVPEPAPNEAKDQQREIIQQQMDEFRKRGHDVDAVLTNKRTASLPPPPWSLYDNFRAGRS